MERGTERCFSRCGGESQKRLIGEWSEEIAYRLCAFTKEDTVRALLSISLFPKSETITEIACEKA